MNNKATLLPVFFLILLPSVSFAANAYEIQQVVSKYVYGPNENVSITGYLRNISSNSTANVTSFVNNFNVSISLINSTNITVSSYNFTTNENGTFFSRSSFSPSATAIPSPNNTGIYTVLANFTGENTTWTSRAAIVVVNARIDDILFQLPKVNFYASENMSITAKTVQRVGDSFVSVSNITLNITVRHTNESVISRFSCVTAASGTCTVNTSAPALSGTYTLEANSFVGFTNFRVVPFDAEAYMKDSSALTFKNIFSRGESGFIEVRVSFNSTAPTGVYNATGDIADSNAANVLNLSSIILNSTNGFVDKIPFTASSSLRVGFYTARISVRKEGGETLNTTTTFQVRDWSLTFTKASRNSGFEYGYTAFPNATLFFEAYPVERANGTVLENLTANFTVLLKNSLGSIVGNASMRYNASCSGKACYEFNLTVPNIASDYALSVSLNYSDDYQSADRTLKVTDVTASAQPSDSEGSLKELFGTTEFIYISVSGKNITANISISNAEVVGVTYENGTKLSYSEANLSEMNLSDAALRWAWNNTVGRLVLDPPRTGGVYLAEIYVNNRSASVTTRFGMNPYDVCTSAKGSADTSTSDYWYQFRTSDTIYFQLTVSEAQNTAGRASTGNLTGYSSMYGRSAQCGFDTTKKRAVTNATVTIDRVLNTQSGKVETLNTTSSTCTSTDSNGGYMCTVQAADSAWDGGKHAVTFSILGDDRITSHKASGFFEARAFYIYGYSSSWANKAASNITLNVNAYEAGSGWWTSSSGLSGTALVDSINYYGGVGEWIWPPIKYDYNVTGLNMTITNGIGSVTLTPGRSSAGRWTGGYYSAVIKATVNDKVDYGEAWFNIRNWDAYAQPVEIRGSSFDYKSSINSRQNVSLYVRITEAGDWSDYNGGRTLGNVTISVKKILDYSQWPPTEMTPSNFTSNAITVNASSPWYSSANAATHGNYLLNISPASGIWESGYFSVILDINSTESGYGWFNVVNFYISTQPTNANGSGYVYNNKGNTPVYFNITATKSQKFSYTAADYVNATITEAALRVWDQVTQSQREFRYTADFNITPLLVNGSQIINVTYLAGSWPSGYYNGEIKMRDTSDNSTSKGWIWFSVQPFRVSSSTSSYNVGTRENATVSISIYEPDYSSSALLNGNYTITGVQETSWSSNVYRITNLNFTLTYNNATGTYASSFRNATTLTINPASGKWRPGYKSGTIIIRDNATGDTQSTWFSFRATSFTDTVNRISGANTGISSNITVNITLTSPAGAPTTGNLSSAFYWGWPSKTRYRFVTGNCDSQTSATCFINRSAIVTIIPPSSGWPEGYNYIYFEYVEPDDAAAIIESYNSVYFYVRQTLTGYMYAVSQNGGWVNSFGQRENVTMFVYSLQNLTGSTVSVNVTNVQVAKTQSGCWSESCRTYQNATFEVMNLTGGVLASAGRNNITSSGYIRINASGSVWELGDYAVRIFVRDQNTGETGIVKDATFIVKDKSAPSITITSPAAEQVINATSILFTATTNEQAVCYLYVYDYGQYDRYFCGSNSTNSTLASCNTARYNNATAYYYNYASKWWGSSGGILSTDSTSHSYNHSTSGMTAQQNYTVKFDCYDSDWNYATNATTFNLIGLGTSNATGNATNATLAITISSPANTTYTTTNISLNYTIANGTASACWYRLNNATNTALPGCGITTFLALNGTNNVTVYANNSAGTVFNSSVRFFTVSTSNATNLTITITSPTNTTYATTNISLNFTLNGTASSCRYTLNQITSIISCANTTFIANEGGNNLTVSANNTNGTFFNSSAVTFTVDTNGPIVTFVAPTPSSGAVVNANHTFINITLNETPDFIRLEFNGTNYTMTNITATRLAWFRNQTNTTAQSGLTLGNYTYKVYANDTYGNMNATSPRTVRINVTA